MTQSDRSALAGACGLPEDAVYCLSCIDSTNDFAKRLATRGQSCALVIASSQSAGKGRMGHTFCSPAGTGLYMSLLMRRPFSAEEMTFLTTAAAVYAAEELERLTRRAVGIKWVNDLYMAGKKVCGILCESGYASDGSPAFCVVGIGLNWVLPPDGFPPDLRSLAGAVFETMPTPGTQYAFIGAVVRRLLTYKADDRPCLLSGYRQRLFLLGQPVSFEHNGVTTTGIAEEIDDMARLLVRLPDGTRRRLKAGEIHLHIKKDNL